MSNEVTVSIDQLRQQVVKSMKQYDVNIAYDVREAADRLTKQGVKKLRKNHGTMGQGSTKGTYNKGWTSKKLKNGRLIHNKKYPSLTHLLEFGHYSRDKETWVDAMPHIKLVEENITFLFEKEVDKILERHGRN